MRRLAAKFPRLARRLRVQRALLAGCPQLVAALLALATRAGAQPARPHHPPQREPEAREAEETQETGEPEPGNPPEQKKRRLPEEEDEEKEPEPQLVPPASDTLAGHVLASAMAAWTIPFGSFEEGTSQTDLVGSGPGFSLDIGVGISRVVMLGAWGQLLTLGASSDCTNCAASSIAFGPFVRYHLVQGLRFDPWLSAGIGWRSTTLSGTPAGDYKYSGPEWLRLQIGGDWYPARMLGIGPAVELDMGTYWNRSNGELGTAAAHYQFLIGARITLDIPGR